MSSRSRRGADNGADGAHDVLAAEEFAMPDADPTIHPHPVVLPDDPTGIGEPHDVLAAEEFAMPAVRLRSAVTQTGNARSRRIVAVAALLLVMLLRRRRARRRRVGAGAPAPGA